jgi:hypothetical protein
VNNHPPPVVHKCNSWYRALCTGEPRRDLPAGATAWNWDLVTCPECLAFKAQMAPSRRQKEVTP